VIQSAPGGRHANLAVAAPGAATPATANTAEAEPPAAVEPEAAPPAAQPEQPAADDGPRPRQPKNAKAKGRRSSVPSWDEIMLGSSRQRD
jgi:hypothetical protein